MMQTQAFPTHWQGLDCDGQRKRYQAIADFVGGSNPTVLDVGCGEAILSTFVPFATYTGIEPNGEAALSARAKGVEVVNATAETFDPEGRTWDVIVLSEMLYYTRDPIAVIERYRRMLRPGGKLVITIFMRHWGVNVRASLKRLFHVGPAPMPNRKCAELVNDHLMHNFSRSVSWKVCNDGADWHWRLWAVWP